GHFGERQPGEDNGVSQRDQEAERGELGRHAEVGEQRDGGRARERRSPRDERLRESVLRRIDEAVDAPQRRGCAVHGLWPGGPRPSSTAAATPAAPTTTTTNGGFTRRRAKRSTSGCAAGRKTLSHTSSVPRRGLCD